jgi:hypothetical protein
MNSIFQRLPNEIVKYILTYEGTILKERNGKYMKQIVKTDERYELLTQIPIKQVIFNHNMGTYVRVRFTANKFAMTMTEYSNHLDMNIYILLKRGSPISETRYIRY